jgi:hypothetical protein
MKIFFSGLSVILFLGSLCQVNADSVKEIQSALQNRQFEEAVKMIDSLLKTADKDGDFLTYLKALSLFYVKDFPNSVESCNKVIQQYGDSPWYRKAVFLKAQCYIQMKQFEEAEKIYDSEVRRLLSESRKEEIARVYFRFAEAVSKKPHKDDLNAPPPNYKKAYELYQKALELEIGRDMKDEIMFRSGRMMQLAEDYGQAINHYHQYLKEFDPNWAGPVYAPRHREKMSKQDKKGEHILQVRYHLAECQLAIDQTQWARMNLEDLIKLASAISAPDDLITKLLRDSRFLMIRTYHIPEPRNDEELELGVKSARTFMESYPKDARTLSVMYEIAESYSSMGRSEEAISAYRDLLAMEYYDPISGGEYYEDSESHTERFQRLRMSSTYKIGEILYSQRKYSEAMEAWNQYVAQFPNGPQWTEAQQRMVHSEFQMGVDLIAEEKYDEAKVVWDKFLEKHPLDERSRQIMFVYGQLHYHKAEKLGEEEYKKAIAEWEKLVNKYPNTEESSLALFRIGQIYEEKLGDWEKALESYRKLTWGSWYGKAQERIKSMTQKKLQIMTERVFRTNEPAQVKVSLRNIKKLTVNIYKLDMEAYWRKMHGITGVENLDIALIAPNETIEYEVPDYQKYKLFEQNIEIPIDGAGVCAVNMSEDDLEATTLVICSDIDAIIKTSRREVLVFAQDMIKNKPVPDAKVLVSDGSKVISEGQTGEDGVFHKKLEGLKDATRITAFITKDGGVASNLLDTAGLGLSQGLTPRGYIYTDRPAYRPEGQVYIKGIIRDVKEGSYSVSQGEIYTISVLDSEGRLLRSEELKLSEFGTFQTEMSLDENASLGEYRISVQSKEDKGKIFTGNFQVQRYQLEKMKLAVEFDQQVYFRGEKVEATFTASYYYGQPVINKPIRYTLPDGRSYTQDTDSEGKLKITFDTTPMQPGSSLVFTGNIEGENVQVQGVVFLARLGFSISVETSAEVVISGETFQVFVETKGADGKPVGKSLKLSVYRQMEQKIHPILAQVPWISSKSKSSGEVRVEEHEITTDEKTGKGDTKLSLDDGGRYILRISGTDRFNQPVSGENTVFISDDKDAVKLRIFAEQTKLKVGEEQNISIHSRLKPSLALVTFEGEGIINHRIMKLAEGWNNLGFTVDHEYFPNFHISVTLIDGQNLRIAGKDFNVERELVISLKLDETYSPGIDAEINITATDQLGNPVKTELSLALVDEALFAIYPDDLQPITVFFNQGIYRDAAMRTISSCTFRYEPPTRQVIKELLEEAKRLEMEEKFARDRAETLEELDAAVSLGIPVSEAEHAAFREGVDDLELADKKARIAGGRVLAKAPERLARARAYVADMPQEAAGDFLWASLDARGISVREEFIDAGYWNPSVKTDSGGKATAKITMPERTTQWRLTARGCSVETLVGQATANTITRKDLFVDIKAPNIFTEGDKVRVLARIHNLSDFQGEAQLRLKLDVDGAVKEDRKKVNIDKNSTAEVVFSEMEIPEGFESKIEVIAQAGDMTDGVSRSIPIRPWGMEYVDSSGDVSSGNETIFLQLPRDIEFRSKRLSISLGPDVNRLIFDLAINRWTYYRDLVFTSRIPPMPGDTGSDLLAVAYALGYLERVGGDVSYNKTLTDYARELVARLVVNQKEDGGWSWCCGSADSDIYASSRNLWALAEARRQGIKVHNETIEKAIRYLKEAFSRAEQRDDNAKSMILHSLSTAKEADFVYANRLYRDRNSLSSMALAYTSLAFVNMDRNEIGGEVLDVLMDKIAEEKDVEILSLTLLAMVSIRPDSPMVEKLVKDLLSRRTFFGFSPYKAKGPAVAALSLYYGKTQFVESDYRLKIFVNEKEFKDIQVRSEQPSILLNVPTEFIEEGQNKVEFQLEGTGKYSYTATLSGFSPEFKDPNSWDKPYIISRHYYHHPLEYEGRTIYHSTTEITQLEDGSRTYVNVDIKHGATNRYLAVSEYIPAGTMLVEGSIWGEHQHYQIGDGMITFYYPPGRYMRDYGYQLVSYAPGTYRAMPTVIRDAVNGEEMRIGKSSTLEVLAPGEKSKDKYKMNDGELYGLGEAYFKDGLYAKALELLSELYEKNSRYNQRDVARMLLWIHTEEKYYDSRKIIEYFEVLRERFPELYIPFDRILVVGKAYRDIEEFERAYLVYKATIDASFVNDSNVSAVLEDEGQFLSSIDFQENLWREYPDSPQVVSSYFALSQAIYSKVTEVEQLAKSERQIPLLKDQSDAEPKKITKLDLLKEVVTMLAQFLTLYPSDPLADDASFSLVNALLDLEDFDTVVKLCQLAQNRYPESDYMSSFQYVEALGFFSQHKYDEAVNTAMVVAEGKSKDRDLARYILGQIYHAEGKPDMAMDWYEKVKDIYPDAGESISYFQEKRVSLNEVKVVRPGEKAEIILKYRNIREASIQVYRVDLMKLYLQEKDLSNIRAVQLAGIEPEFSKTVTLGDGKDYVDKKRVIDLGLKDDSAYLVICRGDDLFTSGLVLITPLDMEVQEDAVSGRVRVNVRDAVKNTYREGVYVKAIGSAEKVFRSGKTDLRGIFIADHIRGKSTVIARDGKDKYAFYRGKEWLGQRDETRQLGEPHLVPQAEKQKADYRANIESMNKAVQSKNFIQFDQMRRGVRKGVKIQEAY